jgi:hypothetical protein
MFLFQGGGDVEGIRGRSGSAGIDHAVRRDDRGLGAADSAVLRRVDGNGRNHAPRRRRLGDAFLGTRLGEKPDSESSFAAARGLLPPNASPWRGESGLEAVVSLGLTIAPIPDAEALEQPCPVPDSFISTFIRPIRC